jgi:hypothetical protein
MNINSEKLNMWTVTKDKRPAHTHIFSLLEFAKWLILLAVRMTVKFLLESFLMFNGCFFVHYRVRVNFIRKEMLKSSLFKRKIQSIFYNKNNQWAPCVFLCILPKPAHLTSDKRPWWSFVMSKWECQCTHIDKL